jgi:hypothetical protein
MYRKIEARACACVSNVRERRCSFSKVAKKLSFTELSYGVPFALKDATIPLAVSRLANVTAVLTATIGVMDQPPPRATLRHSRPHRARDQRLVRDPAHPPAHDPTAEAVQHRREMQHTLACRDLLHIRTPQLVRRLRLKVAADEVRPRLHALNAEQPVSVALTPARGDVRADDL